jgi:nicotinamidase/pyrazinamidase
MLKGRRSEMAEELALDESVGLVVVDVQNDFADPGGSLYVDGGETIIPLVNRLVESAEAAGAFVVYTQDWHPPVTPHFQTQGGVWPVHCVRDTWGPSFTRS